MTKKFINCSPSFGQSVKTYWKTWYIVPFVDICCCLWVLTLLIETKSTKHNFLSSDNVQGCQKWLLAPKGSIITVLSLFLQSEPEFNAAKRAIHWIWENGVNSGEKDQVDKGKKSQKKYPYAVPKLPPPPGAPLSCTQMLANFSLGSRGIVFLFSSLIRYNRKLI